MSDRVAAGAAFLDAQRPGWRDRVDATTLSMGSSSRCVLGQLFGDYHVGIEALDVGGEGTSVDYGFTCDYWGDKEDGCTCDALAPYWRAQLERVSA